MNKLYHKELFNPTLIGLFINPFYFTRKGLFKIMKQICPQITGNVLDYGCGRKPYKDLFENVSTYIGIDYENEGHPHENESIDVFFDGKKIPFENERFDVVFSTEVFEHVEDLDNTINEIRRVLKNEGTLLISVPFVFMEHEMPYDYRRFTFNGIQKFLVQNNFLIQEEYKTTTDIQTLFQTISMIIYSYYMNQNKYTKLLLNMIFISPLTILGIILSFILPNNGRFYSNVIVKCKKVNVLI